MKEKQLKFTLTIFPFGKKETNKLWKSFMQTLETNKTFKNYWNQYKSEILQSQASFSKSPYFTTRINIKFFEESFIAESEYTLPVPGHIPTRRKDDIEFFSAHSRTRLIKFFSQIKLSDYHKINFCTLTFHEDYPKDNFALKKFLDKFLKRLNYNFPNVDWIWRFEMQERGAPHFHFIMMCKNNMKGFSNEKLRQQIHSLFFDIKECNCNHCVNYGFDFIELETPSKAFSYISKYVAKENTRSYAKYSGRRWGSKRSIATNPIETISLRGYQFVYLKKLLRDYYRSNVSKAEYINTNTESLLSWFLICHTIDIRSAILNVLTTPIETIFIILKKAGYIHEDKIFDQEGIDIYNHLNNPN